MAYLSELKEVCIQVLYLPPPKPLEGMKGAVQHEFKCWLYDVKYIFTKDCLHQITYKHGTNQFADPKNLVDYYFGVCV